MVCDGSTRVGVDAAAGGRAWSPLRVELSGARPSAGAGAAPPAQPEPVRETADSKLIQSVTFSPVVAFAGADLRVVVRVLPDAGNRRLQLSMDAPTFYASTERQLDGMEGARRAHLCGEGIARGRLSDHRDTRGIERRPFACHPVLQGHGRGRRRLCSRRTARRHRRVGAAAPTDPSAGAAGTPRRADRSTPPPAIATSSLPAAAFRGLGAALV